jgi:aconitate hydratase
MPITVGHDTAKTRKTLKVGDKSYAYYSIAAAEEAGSAISRSCPPR